MPYALILAGIILTVAGVRGTEKTLFSLIMNDFTGQNSFIWWTVAILGVGAVGYVPDFRKFANAFLALLLVALVLANRGVFAQFTSALRSPIPTAPVATPTPANTNSQSAQGGTQLAKTASTLDTIGKDLALAGQFFGF